MARHVLAAGRPLPEWIAELLASVESDEDSAAARLPELSRAHQELAELVAPARPRALVLLERERRRGGILRSFGPVRLVRQLIGASALFLAAFVASSLSPHVDAAGGDVFETSGTALLANQLFLLSAAGVGACFAALFRVNRHLTEGTYDPRYDASYWIRFLLGLIAGVVLAALIPVEGQFTRPLLALAGGFAAPVLYRVLTRAVEGLESIGGSGKKEPEPAASAGPAIAAVATDEGAATVLAAAAPGAAAPPPPSAPPAEIPPELEGSYRARIVFEGGHVGAARALDGPALARAAFTKLKTIARAAAVAKIGAELSGPFGDVASEIVAGGEAEDMSVVVEDGVATGALHEWATGRGEAPEREVAVDLYDEGGERSSTLKLKDSRVAEYEFEEDPKRPGTYLIRRLVLAQTQAEWLVGALNPVEEAGKLFAKPDAAPPPPPAPPCRGSFARGVAAGLLLALTSVGMWTLQNEGEPVSRLETPAPAPAGCDETGRRDATPCPPKGLAPAAPRVPDIPSPYPCPPGRECTPRPDRCPPNCPSPPKPICPPDCPSPPPPICPPDCPSPPPPICPPNCPSPPPPICPPDCPPSPPVTCPPLCPPTADGCPPFCSPSPPPPPPSPSPLFRRCKQPAGAVVRSQAHARHPGCALYHSEAEPPGHALRVPAPTPPPPGAPAPPRPAAPVATPPPDLPVPRPEQPPPAPQESAPEAENAPALPPGLDKRKDGLPPGLEKKRRPRRPSRPT